MRPEPHPRPSYAVLPHVPPLNAIRGQFGARDGAKRDILGRRTGGVSLRERVIECPLLSSDDLRQFHTLEERSDVLYRECFDGRGLLTWVGHPSASLRQVVG